jgi:hypothetical protein
MLHLEAEAHSEHYKGDRQPLQPVIVAEVIAEGPCACVVSRYSGTHRERRCQRGGVERGGAERGGVERGGVESRGEPREEVSREEVSRQEVRL